MKTEALKLADELLMDNTQLTVESAYMIRRLVEELDKQGEPYVWHMKSNDPDSVKDYWYFIDKPSRESKISHQAIPLYTAPQTKPLSDAEIDDCVGRIALANDFYPEEIPSDRFLKCFAKAIEERHGIK